jgi:hypothetical protein
LDKHPKCIHYHPRNTQKHPKTIIVSTLCLKLPEHLCLSSKAVLGLAAGYALQKSAKGKGKLTRTYQGEGTQVPTEPTYKMHPPTNTLGISLTKKSFCEGRTL